MKSNLLNSFQDIRLLHHLGVHRFLNRDHASRIQIYFGERLVGRKDRGKVGPGIPAITSYWVTRRVNFRLLPAALVKA